MLDPRLLRNELQETADKLARRGLKLDVEAISALESSRKRLQMEAQELQNLRNSRSKQIGKAKAAGEDIQPLLDEVAGFGDTDETDRREAGRLFRRNCRPSSWVFPIFRMRACPTGNDESDNREERRWGTPPEFEFEAKDHVDLGVAGGWIDFEAAAKITGSRFVTLQGSMARLQRALAQFMLDTHTQAHGYTEIYVPYMVNADSLRGTGQLPKFEQDLFHLSGDLDYYLIPDRRGAGHQSGAGHNHRGCGYAAPLGIADALFSQRGGLLRQGHPRHDSPASVRKGGAGADRAAGGLLSGAGRV